MLNECRTRRNKDGSVSNRKGWYRSAASKARAKRAAQAAGRKRRKK